VTETRLETPQAATRVPESPYKGLFPYTEADAAFFFGRATERELIAANLMAARLTVLYGPSGVGKSSVVDAGVAHDLAERERDAVEEDDSPNIALVVFRTWRGEPAAGLAEAVAGSVRRLFPDRDLPDPPGGAPLADVLAHWSRVLGGRLLIVLDQFEEYFVYSRRGDRFDEEFPRAVNRDELRANFLVSIREDALAKLDRFKGRIPYLFDNYLRLDRLDTAAARLAIVEPLRVWARMGEEDVSVEGRLVDDVLEQIGPDVTFGQAGAGTADGRPSDQIETSFLQLVMKKIWEVERAAGSSKLRASTLERLGGAKGIVRAHLTEGLDRLAPEEKKVAAHVFQFLVTRSGQKVAHTADDLADFSDDDPAAVRNVLERLSSRDVRILRRVEAAAGEEGSEGSYEIYHDTLGEPILEWRSTHLQELHEQAAHEQARKERRRASLFAGGAALMLLVAAACLVLYFRAADARRSARSQKLVAQSAAALGVDPDAAVRLASRALGLKKTADAEKAFRRAVGFSPLRVVIGHVGDVYRTEYGGNGTRVLSIGADGKAIVSDAHTGRSISRIGYGQSLLTGGISPSGHRVMTAGADGTIRFWSADTGRQLGSFQVPGLTDASLDPKDSSKVVATSAEGRIRIWRLGSAKAIVSPRLPSTRLTHASFSPDGSRILATGNDKVAWILDATSGRPLHTLRGQTAKINAAVWSPDNRYVVTGGDDGYAYLWDAATGKPVVREQEPNVVTAVAFGGDRPVFAAAGGNRVHVYSLQGRQLAELRGDTDVINDIEFRPGHGKVLVTASNDGTARVWDYAELTETTLRPLLGDRGGVDNAVFSPDGRFVLTGSTDGSARIWSVFTGIELWHDYGGVLAAAYSPDGKRIVTYNHFHYYLWDGSTGRSRGRLPGGSTTAVSSIRFSPDGKLLAVAETGGVIFVRRTTDWEPFARITRTAAVDGIAFSPSGRLLAVAGADGWAGIYVARTGKPVRELHANGKTGPAHPFGGATGVAWSSDGRFVVTTGTDGFVHVWDASSGRLLATLQGHLGRVQSPSFAPQSGSDLVVTAGVDHTARVWDVKAQKQVALLEGDAPISAAAFSPDGSRVVTGDGAGVTEVWDWRHEKLLGTLPMHAGSVTSVSFSPKGRRILSSSYDMTAKIYTCDMCLPLDRLREVVDRRERMIRSATP
jgi:WD40 repeat protein